MAKSKTVLEDLRSFMQLCIDSESQNRTAALEDIRFSGGDADQWPTAIKTQRMLDRRPCLTIDKTDTFVRSVVNNMRQQRPRIKVHPVSDGADQATAAVRQGLIRHIEVSSNADSAYDTAADYQTRMGWGYWRILSRYSDEKSWDQDLHITRIRNPFTVYFDPSSIEPDGLDATRVAITGKMRKADFEAKYPGKKTAGWSLIGAGDDVPTRDEITLVEFLRFEDDPADLVRLSTGESMWADEYAAAVKEGKIDGAIEIDRRRSMKRQLKWSLCSGAQELDKRDLPGRYTGVIPCYGAEKIDNGTVVRYGMVRALKDPQRMYNFWRSAETEFVALAPKAPWLMAEGQDEGHEDEWNLANVKNYSSLKYKPVTDDSGNTLPPPMRQPPQQIPAAHVNAAMQASEDLKAVAGMFDPSLGAPGQETSGVMVGKRQQQSDLSNFHFYDNLTRSIRATGIVIDDLIPHYYDTPRVIRILGDDGVPESVQINEQAVGKVLNDMTGGKFDVVMDTGPGYDTKRLEARDAMLELVRSFPQIAQIGGDLILRQFDAPGMEALADRVAAMIPAAQMEKKLPKDLDPEVRKFVAGIMSKMQQNEQELQKLQQEKAAKVFGIQEREHAVTQREMLKEDAETERQMRREQAETDRLHTREVAGTHREILRLGADEKMNTQDNHTSLVETNLTTDANLMLGHLKAQQHGIPNNNRPTNQQ
jgi:hypothetical protein